jgi:glycosyltransferase involved in cell wall biosynthesis
MHPLVSCILVTRDRPAFFAQALRCYAAQDYPRRELIVVDDGATPVEAQCAGMANLTYCRLREPFPIGSKLNLGIQIARGGILQKIDDDDYYGPSFLSTSVEHLRRSPKRRTIVAWCCFVVLIAGEPHLYFSGHGWHAGGTLCFRRALWERTRFRDMYNSSDSWFIRDTRPTIVRACAAEQYVVVRHGRNTWRRIKGADSVEAYFRRRRFGKGIRRIVGDANAPFYESLMAGRTHASWTPSA